MFSRSATHDSKTMKLRPIAGSELTSYVIELLSNRGITTAREFLTTDIDELAKVTNLSRNAIEDLRAKVHKVHRPKRLNLLRCYNESKLHRPFHGFYIESIDDLLGDQRFCSGRVFEVYGPAGIGKTQLCLTVVKNIVNNSKVEALYVDTKNDFSASRLFEMFRAQRLDNSQCGHLMQHVKVERTMSLKGVFRILKHLYELMDNGSMEVASIKVVVVDSLPAVWFIHNSDEERFERKSLLCQISNLVHRIARQHMIAFLIVNLAVQTDELLPENFVTQSFTDVEADSSSSAITRRRSTLEENSNGLSLKPTLGRHWISVPHVRLLLKMPEDAGEEDVERLVEVTRNSFGPINVNCRVCITEAGVVN